VVTGGTTGTVAAAVARNGRNDAVYALRGGPGR